MSLVASIGFAQGATTGAPGRAIVGVSGTLVTCRNGDNSNVVSWTWDLLDVPNGSSLTPGVLASGPSASLASFTPDVPGCYRIQLTAADAGGFVKTDVRNFAVPTARGWIIPSYKSGGDELNFDGNARGWAHYMDLILADLSALGYQGVEVDTVDLPKRPILNFSTDANLNGGRVNPSCQMAVWDDSVDGLTSMTVLSMLTPTPDVTANYSPNGQELVRVDSTAGALTVTFPDTSLVWDAMQIRIRDVAGHASTHNVTILAASGQTFENPTSPGTFLSSFGVSTNWFRYTWEWNAARNRWDALTTSSSG